MIVNIWLTTYPSLFAYVNIEWPLIVIHRNHRGRLCVNLEEIVRVLELSIFFRRIRWNEKMKKIILSWAGGDVLFTYDWLKNWLAWANQAPLLTTSLLISIYIILNILCFRRMFIFKLKWDCKADGISRYTKFPNFVKNYTKSCKIFLLLNLWRINADRVPYARH